MLRDAPDWLQLCVHAVLLAGVGGWVVVRFALPQDLMAELAGKLPAPLRRVVFFVLTHLRGQNYGAA
jgi:hypothetical protein